MPRIQVEAIVSAQRSPLFQLAEDFAQRLAWDKSVLRIRFDQRGVTARVRLLRVLGWFSPLGMRMEYIGLAAPALMAVNMLDGPRFLNKLKSVWRFEGLENDATKVVLTCDFRSKWPWLATYVDPLIIRVLRYDFQKTLDEFKRQAELDHHPVPVPAT